MKALIIPMVTLCLTLSGCAEFSVPPAQDNPEATENQASSSPIPERDWQTTAVSESLASYEIPADWDKSEEFSTESSSLYKPSHISTDEKPSNVTVVITKTEAETPGINIFTNEYITKIVTAVSPNAKDIAVSDRFATREGQAFQATYRLDAESEGGRQAVQTQIHIIKDYYSITILATDFVDGVHPEPLDAARHIAETLTITD